jgi:prophage regulatory protein
MTPPAASPRTAFAAYPKTDVAATSPETAFVAAFPKTGFVRLASILAPRGPIPVSKSTWWAGVKSGHFPKPTKLGDRITVWRAEDIRKLFEQVVA